MTPQHFGRWRPTPEQIAREEREDRLVNRIVVTFMAIGACATLTLIYWVVQ